MKPFHKPSDYLLIVVGLLIAVSAGFILAHIAINSTWILLLITTVFLFLLGDYFGVFMHFSHNTPKTLSEHQCSVGSVLITSWKELFTPSNVKALLTNRLVKTTQRHEYGRNTFDYSYSHWESSIEGLMMALHGWPLEVAIVGFLIAMPFVIDWNPLAMIWLVVFLAAHHLGTVKLYLRVKTTLKA